MPRRERERRLQRLQGVLAVRLQERHRQLRFVAPITLPGAWRTPTQGYRAFDPHAISPVKRGDAGERTMSVRDAQDLDGRMIH